MRKPTILVVEDDLHLLEGIREILEIKNKLYSNGQRTPLPEEERRA